MCVHTVASAAAFVGCAYALLPDWAAHILGMRLRSPPAASLYARGSVLLSGLVAPLLSLAAALQLPAISKFLFLLAPTLHVLLATSAALRGAPLPGVCRPSRALQALMLVLGTAWLLLTRCWSAVPSDEDVGFDAMRCAARRLPTSRPALAHLPPDLVTVPPGSLAPLL